MYGCWSDFVPDNKEMIEQAIKEWLDKGADMVFFCTGGMSEDPDDLTPSAIRDTGCEIITYGTPVSFGSYVPFVLLYRRQTGTGTSGMRHAFQSNWYLI